MIVTVDGHRLEAPALTDSTLQALLDQIRTQQLGDRLIVSVTVDGRRYTDDELHDILSQPVAADAQLDLETADRQELVCEALRGLAREFADAGGRLGDIAERLNSDDVAGAVRDVGRFAGLWQTCHRALAQCGELLDEDLTQRAYDGRPLLSWLQELITKLRDLREALDARDMVFLADLVRYELPSLGRTWQALLDDLAEQISPAAQPP